MSLKSILFKSKSSYDMVIASHEKSTIIPI